MHSPTTPAVRTIRVLMVCTANICRSPMAEGIMRSLVDERHLPLRVASAGIDAIEGPPARGSVEAMAARGIDIAAHRAHQIQPVDIEAADLLLTMERRHGVEILAAVPSAFGRTFTLPEFVRRASAVGPANDMALPEWLALVHAGRDHRSMLHGPADDEVDDPFGRNRRSFERCADRLVDLVTITVGLLPTVPVAGDGVGDAR